VCVFSDAIKCDQLCLLTKERLFSQFLVGPGGEGYSMRRDTGFPTWQLVAVVAVTGCLLMSFAWAADQGTGAVGYSYQKQVIARVEAVQGDTKVQRAGEAQFKKIGVKAPLYVMDFLATGKNSKL
jgi:hypothetical protein